MREVESSPDLERILALPRRDPTPPPGLAEELTALVKHASGTMALRPLQGLALHDIGTCGGGFLPLDVGEGKTLISLLTPYILNAKRPLVVLPANLIEKTERERRALAKHWPILNTICFKSYQWLGLVPQADWLESFAPDLIIADEVQKLKNTDAAVTRRFGRYFLKNPDTRFVGMTGTIMRKSILDFAHFLFWALRDRAPIPLDPNELRQWALALDERVENEFERLEPGALVKLCTAEDLEAAGGDMRTAARLGFRRRLRETPGVVTSATSGTEVKRKCVTTGRVHEVRLEIRALRYEISPTTSEYFRALRQDKVTPDGYELLEAVDVWRHARELALGFHQIWDPRPPEPWREARSAWFSAVRAVLAHSRTWDSPEHVAQACDAGRLPSARAALEAWRAIKDTFIPNPVPVWHDDSAIRAAAAWMQAGPGIVWTEHVAFAQRLARHTGATYYGAKGLSDDGRFVDDGDPAAAVIVSVDANREGRNLQKKWHRNLVVSPEEGADKWQQLIGRTHRPGQASDVVTVDVFLGCLEHVRAWEKALAGAASIKDTVGAESKLLIADVRWPSPIELASFSGPRWGT